MTAETASRTLPHEVAPIIKLRSDVAHPPFGWLEATFPLADGVLYDVTQTAREAGFKVPVALTAQVWADVNDLSGRCVSRDPGQSPDGRLWDLLFMAAHAARRRENRNASTFVYALIMPVGAGNTYRAKCHIGPGDEGEAVVTIMRPEED